MAIYPKVGSYVPNSPAAEPPNIEAWTERATQSLNTIVLSNPLAVRGTLESLAIPLDETREPKAGGTAVKLQHDSKPDSTYRPQREPLRRDSMNRREALLKGKEGSRQRRRWENDRLLNNPWAQPPLPVDWEVHPTHPKRSVPYYLAPLWDAKVASRAVEEKIQQGTAHGNQQVQNQKNAKIPKELRGKLRKARAARGLLQDLEEQIRRFLQNWEEKTKTNESDETDLLDSEDEEIVFVGRNGQMNDMPPSPSSKRTKDDEVPTNQMVFDSPADDHGASFGRWLVHNIATYYGLRTWSVTVGDPARREAYIGIEKRKPPTTTYVTAGGLPRPLWAMV